MKNLLRWAGAIALALSPAPALAQVAGSSVVFPAGWAPGTSICVQQADLKCTPVSTTNPLPVTGAVGGGGGSGDASASNQTTQITAANLTNTRIGDVTAPATGSTNQRLALINTTLGSPFQAGGSIGNTAFGISGTLPAFAATPTFNLGTLNGAATAANQTATTAALPAKDTNGDLRVPTVSVTPFYVSLAVNTSTEILAASATRIGYELQCAGTAAVGLSRTHATLTSATPSAGGVDWVIPAGTSPAYLPAYVSGAGVTGYTATTQACWGVSYARQ